VVLLAQLISLICQLVPSFRQHQMHHSATSEVVWHRKASSHALDRELPIIIRTDRRLVRLKLATHDTTPRADNDKRYFEKLSRSTQSILLLEATKITDA
jgi:hypothetical protein